MMQYELAKEFKLFPAPRQDKVFIIAVKSHFKSNI